MIFSFLSTFGYVRRFYWFLFGCLFMFIHFKFAYRNAHCFAWTFNDPMPNANEWQPSRHINMILLRIHIRIRILVPIWHITINRLECCRWISEWLWHSLVCNQFHHYCDILYGLWTAVWIRISFNFIDPLVQGAKLITQEEIETLWQMNLIGWILNINRVVKHKSFKVATDYDSAINQSFLFTIPKLSFCIQIDKILLWLCNAHEKRRGISFCSLILDYNLCTRFFFPLNSHQFVAVVQQSCLCSSSVISLSGVIFHLHCDR